MPRTGGIDARLWATPNTMDYLPQRSLEALKKQAETSRKGRTCPANLQEQVCEETVRLWPTPSASDRGRTAINPHMTKNGTIRHIGKNGTQSYARLDAVAAMFPTPKARDAKDTTRLPPSRLADPGKDSLVQRVGRGIPKEDGGQLNPTWVEWLMGFPIGWTDLDA